MGLIIIFIDSESYWRGGGIVLMVSIFIYSFSYVVIGGWVVIEDNFYMLL